MHQSSLENMQKSYSRFVKTRSWPGRELISVVDIGGADVNGSYSDIFSGPEFIYHAVDIAPGEGVSVVLNDPYILPYSDCSVDIVISGQAFEHVEFFWLLFAEMVRVIKKDGIIIVIAPSSGPIHRFPVDCYRFYPDAFYALAKYAKCHVISLVHDNRGPWNDLVGVFSKVSRDSIEPQRELREWHDNRYESECKPVICDVPYEDPSAELKQGELPYLEFLEKVHELLNPKLYLEIGVRHGYSFRLSSCESIGIDPAPDLKVELSDKKKIYELESDNFFEKYEGSLFKDRRIDLAFIDGMHLFEFALRDFINIEKFASENAVVIVDDIFPNHRIQAQRKRQTCVWTGDIWKLAICLKETRPDLKITLIDTFPTGIMTVSRLNPENTTLVENYNPIVRKYKSRDLVEDTQNSVLQRVGSIRPNNQEFWKNLNEIIC